MRSRQQPAAASRPAAVAESAPAPQAAPTPRRATGAALGYRAAAAVLAATLAGCGSVLAPAGQAGSPGGGPASSADSRCPASSLRMTLDTAATGVSAGSSFIPVDFTNISPGTCRLTGYPVVSFAVSASGHQVGTAAASDRAAGYHMVVLAPGAIAHAWLQVSDALNIPASRCHPVTAGGLRVSLQGEQGASYLKHAFPACAAARQGSEILMIQPIQPGRARRGTAQ